MPWYVVYTKPNSEKKVASNLEKRGIKVYCPVYEKIRQWSDRKKKIIAPLFRSYIFIFLNNYEDEKLPVLLVAGVVRFLFWLGKPAIVREVEIQAIQDFLNKYKGSNITVDFTEGAVLAIKEGPLTGQSGTLISIRGNKAILMLKSLKLNLTAEVPVSSISATN
jgi:transcriptional antiterminator RfaH